MNCIIIDDNRAFLDSVVPFLVSEGARVLGTASSGSAALELARSVRADVALVDVYLGDEDGIALTAALRAALPAMEVVLISTHDRDDLLELLSSSDAAGFLRKDSLTLAAITRLIS